MTTKAAKVWSQINGSSEGSPAGVFLVALMYARALTPAAVRRASGLDAETVSALWAKAEAVGIIKDGKLYAAWDDTEEGVISLIMDSLVLQGHVERVPG